MTFLSLKFLGSLDIALDHAPVVGLRSAKVEALLAYLAVEQKRPLRRDALVALLWPDEPLDTARTNLRQSLTRLQKGIDNQNANPPFLLISRETVQFNAQSQYALDVTQFQKLLAACPTHGDTPERQCAICVKNLQTAVSLYNGDFLAHFFISDSPVFEQWVLPIRERLHQQALQALQWLANYHENRGEYVQALTYAQHQTRLEPWREEPYQQQMRLLARQGNRSAALVCYETCRRTLENELGVAPTAETTQLYHRIQTAPAHRPHNLPDLPNSFLGREEETAQLLSHLAQPQRRLVTLLGAGGMGKTSLVLHAGKRIAHEYVGPFANGLYYVPLAGINGPTQMVVAIANALGMVLRGSQDPLQQVINQLQQQEMLLILDNLEQLGPAGSEVVTALLEGTTAVKLLITSRERLNLRGEWILTVGGLSYPATNISDSGWLRQHVDSGQYQAMQLFIDRARQNQPGRQIGQSWEDELAIVRICQLCEGLPLALELAATWAGMLSCGQIATELSKGLELLQTNYYDVEPRHRSLQVVFEHSWELLSAQEKRVLAQLSVFQGGFDHDAGTAVADASLIVLRQLIDKSIVYQGKSGRFSLHELLRQFAAEKLAAWEETAVVQRRHAAYFADLVQQQESRWPTQENSQAVAIIRADIQNVRAGWYWTAVNQDTTLLNKYLHSMLNFYSLVSWYQEAQQAFELCVLSLTDNTRLPNPASQADADITLVQGRALSRQAAFCYRLGDLHKAAQLAQQSVDLLTSSTAFTEKSFAYQVLGMAWHQLGVFDKAKDAYFHSYEAAQQTDDNDRKANLGLRMGEILYIVGAYDEAKRWQTMCLEMYQAAGKEWGIAESTRWLGEIAYAQDHFAAAEKLFNHSLTLYEAIGNSSGVAHCRNQLGKLRQGQQDFAGAAAQFDHSLAIYQENGEELGLADTLANLGELARMTGAYETARRYLGEALERATAIEAAPLILQTLTNAANLLLQTHVSSAAPTLARPQEPNSQLLKAHDLLALVVEHPAAPHLVRRQAQERLGELQAILPPSTLTQLTQRAKSVELRQIVSGVLAEAV
ncbi:MAG: BTAD domain-containing putative transcriptional regulator [Chloroflexota bacterium]